MLKAALSGLAALFAAGAVQAQPPVWVVKDKDSELVLFGSVHILPPGLDWEPAALKRAIDAADDLWFELPVDATTEAETARLAGELGVLPPDQSLFKLLPVKDAQRLMRVAAMYDVSPGVLDRLQPWLAEIALAGGAYRKAGADAASGSRRPYRRPRAPRPSAAPSRHRPSRSGFCPRRPAPSRSPPCARPWRRWRPSPTSTASW